MYQEIQNVLDKIIASAIRQKCSGYLADVDDIAYAYNEGVDDTIYIIKKMQAAVEKERLEQ